MKKVHVVITFIAFSLVVYLISYSTSKYWYPVSAEGPGALYESVFAPLNKSSIDNPVYWTDASTNNGYLKVYVDWVNMGNGYVYLKYKGSEFRVQAGSGLLPTHEGTVQQLKFTSVISTDETFRSSRIVTASLE